MPADVFISYSRVASSEAAQALAWMLGTRAFFDLNHIEDGGEFPEVLLSALLDASVVVIFASADYSQSRFCRLECQLALAAGDDNASHLVLALDEGFQNVLDTMPTPVAARNWPPSMAT